MNHRLIYAALLLFLIFTGLFGAGMHSAIIDQALVGRELVKASLIPGFLATIAWFIWIRSSQLTGAR